MPIGPPSHGLRFGVSPCQPFALCFACADSLYNVSLVLDFMVKQGFYDVLSHDRGPVTFHLFAMTSWACILTQLLQQYVVARCHLGQLGVVSVLMVKRGSLVHQI